MQFVINKCRYKSYTLQKRKILHPKTWLIMRWTAILILVGSLHVSAGTYSQKVTLKARNTPLVTVLKTIEQQSGYHFVYLDKWMQQAKPVTADITALPLHKAIDACLKGQPLSYTIVDKMVVLKLKEIPSVPPSDVIPTEVEGSLAHDIRVHITDSTGSPLQGASVVVKGTKQGGQTDADGNITLAGLNGGETLVVSFVGYETSEVNVGDNVILTIKLRVSTSPLDEMQVIAYGSTTKRLTTGSISRLTSDNIEKQPVQNLAAAMIGRMAGVQVTQATGVPGGGFTIQIRGRNSIKNGNAPLYIVDGVPFTSISLSSGFGTGASYTYPSTLPSTLNNISITDIESIEVLKDADATAIYGSRGANGVILITTKKGKEGKTQVVLNTSIGFSEVPKYMKLLNTNQYLEMRREAFANDGATMNVNSAYDLLKWDTSRYTNWQGQLIGNKAASTNAGLSISGGNDITNFNLNAGYNKEGTVFPGAFSDKKGNLHLNVAHSTPNRKFKTAVSINYVYDNTTLPQTDLTVYALTLPPDAPELYDDNGNLNWEDGTWKNPISFLYREYQAKSNNLISNLNFSYQLAKGLELRTSLGYNNLQLFEVTTIPKKSISRTSSEQSGSYFNDAVLNSWIIEPQIEYTQEIGKVKVNVLGGSTFQDEDRTGKTLFATGFSNDALLKDPQSAADISIASATQVKYRYAALFARLNLNFTDKYIVNFTGRRDGSSRFGPGNQFANFGAIGAAWIFSNENLIKKNQSPISYGKLRFSYGVTGSDQIQDYGYLDTYNSTSYPYQGNNGLVPTGLYNKNYGWERNIKLEAGLDIGFFNDRILLTADFYRNRSSNQLVGLSLPPATGFTSVQMNLPATVQNLGWEFELTTENIKGSAITWTTSVNLTIPKTKLIEFPNIDKSSYANYYTVGKSLLIQKKYHALGVNPSNGLYQFSDKINGGATLNPTYPGDLFDLKEISQKYYGGLQNSLSLKRWQLDVFIQYVNQTGNNYMALSGNGFPAPGLRYNQPVEVLKRWQKPGDVTGIQKFTQTAADTYNAYYLNQSYGDDIITDASFLRLKNVSLSYSFPENILKKCGVSSSKIYVSGQNLFTITKYLGMDPENQLVTSLPPLRTVMVGIQIVF